MKFGLVIYTNDSESVWHALRFGNFSLAMGNEVNIFLLGKGVEIESADKHVFKVTEQLKTFIETGGKVFACGTCLELRQLQVPETFKVSTLEDLFRIVKESDRVLTF